MPKSSRRPPCCKRCLERPLLSQCLHSKAGRKYLADHLEVSGGRLGRVETEASTSDNQANHPTSNASTPMQNLTDNFSTPVRHGSLPGSHSESETPHGLPGDGDDEDDEEIIPTPASKNGRVYATSRNPIYGHVEGSKRGNDTYSVVHTKPVPKPLIDSRLATRRFCLEMQSMISRCERVVAETGCWLYLSAQHSTANRGFISYASPRLRRDGRQQITTLQNSFNTLYISLLNSRRQDALQLSLEVQKSQEILKSVEAELETQSTLIAEKDAFIARLQNQLQGQSTSNSETV